MNTAPKIIQYTDQADKDLHAKIPQGTDPSHNNLREHIEDTVASLSGEQGPMTYVRTTPGRRFLSLIKERVKRLWK